MITGINSDVVYEGAVYHVQTEDHGTSNPLIESLVYVRGEILDSIRRTYDNLVNTAPREIQHRLDIQHRTVIKAVLRGRYASPTSADTQPPEKAEKPELIISAIDEPCAGEDASIMVLLRAESSGRPFASVPLQILYFAGTDQPKRIYTGNTDARGFHLAEFRIPSSTTHQTSLLIEAAHPDGPARATIPVLVPQLPAPSASVPTRPADRPHLIVSELGEPRAGDEASCLILLRGRRSLRPISGAKIQVLLSQGADEIQMLYEATTDSKGFHLAEFRVPPVTTQDASLQVQAECPLGIAELVIPVLIP